MIFTYCHGPVTNNPIKCVCACVGVWVGGCVSMLVGVFRVLQRGIIAVTNY